MSAELWAFRPAIGRPFGFHVVARRTGVEETECDRGLGETASLGSLGLIGTETPVQGFCHRVGVDGRERAWSSCRDESGSGQTGEA